MPSRLKIALLPMSGVTLPLAFTVTDPEGAVAGEPAAPSSS